MIRTWAGRTGNVITLSSGVLSECLVKVNRYQLMGPAPTSMKESHEDMMCPCFKKIDGMFWGLDVLI